MASRTDGNADSPRIVIIGAGIAGISFAVALKRQLGYENYTIYERASDVGGTWRDNTYPGCASDIPINLYSLSTDLKPDWDFTHGLQPQIHAYWKDLSHRHGVHSHIAFNRNVVSADWDIAAQLYRIVIEDVETGTKQTETAQILISALGVLSNVRYPDILGLDTFKGPTFHVAKWDHNVDLEGKRVGIIGNGASAVQLIPNISTNPKVQITQFCRTPNWFVPVPFRTPVSSTIQWINKNIPLAMRIQRHSTFIQNEIVYWTIFSTGLFRPMLQKVLGSAIRSKAPAKYHDKLIPKYPIGCRRLLLDVGYLNSLHRPNVTLNWDGVESITENGIVTLTGEALSFDVLILATGYISDDFPLPLRGTTQTIQEYNDSTGGPQAYLGTTVPGFPNFFMVAGPNVFPSHTSLIFVEECQIDYSLKLIKPILDGVVSSFEVTSAATNRYNEKIHARIARSVLVGCTSWYRKGGVGKVFTVFPGSGVHFWWWVHSVKWSHYKAVPSESWDAYQRSAEGRLTSRISVGLIGLAVLVWVLFDHVKLLGP